MNDYLKDALDEMTLAEIDDFKKNLTEYVKERKATEAEYAETAFKNSVEVGDIVKCIFKGEEIEAEVAKINEKTFSVFMENEFGETVKKPIRFDKYRGKAKQEAVA